jgi:hypothetical protein
MLGDAIQLCGRQLVWIDVHQVRILDMPLVEFRHARLGDAFYHSGSGRIENVCGLFVDILASMIYRLLFVLTCVGLFSVAAQEKYAPLPDKVVQAKTIFLQNDSGEEKFGDNVFQELQQWGRWRIVTNRSGADIVIALDRKPIDTKDRWRNNWYLRILDPTSGEVLWIVKRSVRMMRMGNVAATLGVRSQKTAELFAVLERWERN